MAAAQKMKSVGLVLHLDEELIFILHDDKIHILELTDELEELEYGTWVLLTKQNEKVVDATESRDLTTKPRWNARVENDALLIDVNVLMKYNEPPNRKKQLWCFEVGEVVDQPKSVFRGCEPNLFYECTVRLSFHSKPEYFIEDGVLKTEDVFRWELLDLHEPSPTSCQVNSAFSPWFRKTALADIPANYAHHPLYRTHYTKKGIVIRKINYKSGNTRDFLWSVEEGVLPIMTSAHGRGAGFVPQFGETYSFVTTRGRNNQLCAARCQPAAEPVVYKFKQRASKVTLNRSHVDVAIVVPFEITPEYRRGDDLQIEHELFGTLIVGGIFLVEGLKAHDFCAEKAGGLRFEVKFVFFFDEQEPSKDESFWVAKSILIDGKEPKKTGKTNADLRFLRLN